MIESDSMECLEEEVVDRDSLREWARTFAGRFYDWISVLILIDGYYQFLTDDVPLFDFDDLLFNYHREVEPNTDRFEAVFQKLDIHPVSSREVSIFRNYLASLVPKMFALHQ
jgi:hypothetical protein